MRSSIFFFATAALAAPINVADVTNTVDSALGSVEGVVGGINLRDVVVPTVPVSNILDKVTPVVDGINIDNIISRDVVVPDVPVSNILGQVTDVVKGINAEVISRDVVVPDVPVSNILSEVDSVVKGIDAGIISRDILDILPALNLGSIVSLISEVLTGTLTLVSDIKGVLEGLEGHVTSVDVDGAFRQVEGILSQVLTKVQETANFAHTGLDLTKLNPTLALLSVQLETVTSIVQGLVDDGAVGPIVDQVRGELSTVTGLLAGLQ